MNLRLVRPPRRHPTGRLALLFGLAVAVVSFGGLSKNAAAGLSDYSATLYLSNTASSQLTGSWQLVTAAPSTANTATQNRTAFSTTGYQDFVPGVGPGSFLNSPIVTPSATTQSGAKGWLVDNSGSVSFAAGSWTFSANVTDNASATTPSPSGSLVVGVWKVTLSGSAIATSTNLVDPTCSGGSAPCGDTGTNFITTSGSSSQSLTVSLGAISLQSNEHLYVQYWRHQSAAFCNPCTLGTPAGNANRVAKLVVNDGNAKITHPTANGFPNVPTLGSVATRINNRTPSLSANFSDPDASDTGTLSFQLCSDSACSSVLQSGSSSSGIANGSSGSWTPTSLADGTYYWRAESTDSAGNVSGWSSSSSFVVDTVPPATAALVSPAAAARVNATQVSATFSDPDAGDTGTLNFQLCSNSSCSSVVTSGSSASGIANNANGTWSPTGVADGTYYWRAQAQDAAGNQSASWSATRSFVLDTTAPNAPALGSVGSLLNAIPNLSAQFSDPDGSADGGTLTFHVCSDSSCTSIAGTSPSVGPLANNASGNWTPASLPDGTYWWEATAHDVAGNTSATTISGGSFTLDTTAPATPTLGPVAARTNVTPTLSAGFSDPDAADTGTVSLQLCSTSSCASVLQSATSPSGIANNTNWSWTPSHLVDGTYFWRARALDAAGNASAWSAAGSFIVDTTPATTPTLNTPASAARVTTTQVNATFNDPDVGDSGTISFQLCNDSACSSVVDSTTSATTNNGSSATWSGTAHGDGTYYWRARGQDIVGNAPSGWSAARSFILDTTAPAATPGTTPPLVNAIPALSGTFSDPSDPTDTGTILFQVCSDSSCTSVVQSGSSPGGIATGASGGWTPSALADGTYYWRVGARDVAGNQSAWPGTTSSFQLDTTAPTAPVLGAVASRTNTTPQLSATFADPDAADTGTLSFQLCSTSSCSSVLQSGTSASGLANGAAANWTPSTLADGTYYWRARGQDAAGNQSAWSSAGSFVVDTVAPSAPSLVSPASASRVNSITLSTAFSDSDAGDTGTLTFQLCGDAACSSVVASNTSASVANGATAAWTPATPADGAYYWRASAKDAAGNQSPWSAVRSVTLDTVAPSAPGLVSPADGGDVNTAPTLTASFSDTDAGDTGTLTFQICGDAACTAVVQSGTSSSGLSNGASAGWTPTGLSGAVYYWRASSVDAAGNASSWSTTRSFTFDKTPPAAPTLGKVPSRINAMPSLWATFSDPDAGDTGSVWLQVCSDTACNHVVRGVWSPSGVGNGGDWTWVPDSLGDGTYYWRASAKDAAGNQSSWSAAASFVIDRRAPVVTPVVPANTRVNTPPLLSARADDANDATDEAQVFFDLCADEACTQILATGGSGLVPAGSVASWQPPGPLNDGTYYWRVLAADILGNQSPWSSSQSFVVDTKPPSVPDLSAPDDGALVNKVQLSGSDPGKAGRLQFEVCADATCDTVVASGSSPSVDAGASASWTGGGLPDGSYFWRANAVDEAGNSSGWSATQAFTLDTTPPAKPRALTATVSGTVLSLAWRPPAGGAAPVGYYLIINGRRSKLLPAKTRAVKITLQRHDLRTFAIAAVDKAGNVGAPTVVFGKDVLRRSLKEAVLVRAPKRPRH